ncbi:MAG: ATP-binding cassette domain-containing protein [Anaerovibrio sp.]|nr:ATP-binding cassette domain-containing protein [Anaerovibrio sp.]
MGILDVKGLSKAFGDLPVLNNIDLSVQEGERIAIIGASGCGKSVFLRCLNLLEVPDKGHITIDGEEITAKGANIDLIRRKMGMVFQKFHLFSHYNVLDNLCLAPTQLLGMDRATAEKKAMLLLSQVGLAAKAKVFPTVLSGGQQQRVAICRALMMEPKVLLLDEPTSALDPTMVGEVLAVIRMLAKQKLTMIIVTHEMKFAQEVADRILFFADQGIYEQGSPEEIFNSPQREKTISFICKHTFFSYEISKRSEFDLMKLQGGIWSFAEKYGINDKHTYLLQLSSEELIYEFFHGSFADGEEVDLKLDVTYAQADDRIILEVVSGGAEYNPILAESQDDDGMEHIGITLLKKRVSSISYAYEGGKNRVRVEVAGN